MTTIVTRAGKGSPLTNNEMDTNLTNLNTAKIENTSATGSTPVAVGTTAERDGTPAAGYTRFNTDTGSEEYYNGTAWVTVADSSTAVTLTGTQTLTNKTLTSPVVNGTGVNFSDGSIQNTAATGFGFKNRIINGAMMIDQRNAGASVTPDTGNAYNLDRWKTTNTQASKYTVQQNAGSVTPPAGFKNYAGITSASAYTVLSTDNFNYAQNIEGLNVSDLGWGAVGASAVTLSFWVRSSLTGSFGGSVQNSAQTRSYPFSFTISSANTWEQKSITVAGDTTGTWLTTNGIGLRLVFSLGSGSTYITTANAWAAGGYYGVTGQTNLVSTNGATFYITGVQLEKGSTATSFDYRPYGTELALCQRYYEKSYDIATTPGTSTITNACRYVSPRTVNPSASDDVFSVTHIVSKRATPTITIYSTTGASGNVRNISNATDVASGGTTAGENSYSLRWSMTDGMFYAWQWVSSSEL